LNTQNTYDFITKKLGRTSAPDTTALWQQMEQVLDREMPVDRKKKRFFWLFPLNVWLLITGLSGMAAAGIYFATARQQPNKNISQNTISSPAGGTDAQAQYQQTNKAVATTSTASTTSSQQTSSIDHQPATSAAPEQPIMQTASPAKQNNRKNMLARKTSAATGTPSASGKHNATTLMQPAFQAEVFNAELTASSMKFWPHVPGARTAAFSLTPLQPASRSNIAPKTPKALPHSGRGFTAGIGLQMQVPIGSQQHSGVGFTGNHNHGLDYLPSVFIQYHLNRKLSFRTGLQWMTPQYVRELNMYENYFDATSNQYREEDIKLKKLYYLTIPVTVQYQVLPRFQVGAGIEYAHLTRSVFEKQSCLWQEDAGTWWKPWETNTVSVMDNPTKTASESSAATPLTPMDTAAISLAPHDWRFLLNANYQWRRLQIGVQASSAFRPYINTTQKGYLNAPVRDVNRSLQFYLRYTLFDTRRK
jgi:hypothetical protein